jgi:Raf kinase inhibitor-like YbhB/YbcL family protein
MFCCHSAIALSIEGRPAMSMSLKSPAFAHLDEAPKQYTCDGADISPALNWTEIPANAKSLVLIVDDPDAPDPAAPKMTWVHWLLYNIPPSSSGLTENIAPNDLPEGTLQGRNDWKQTGYRGPCPPIGRHRYFFKLYALDIELPDLNEPDKARLEKAMSGHILDQAELIGTYQRK